MVILELRTNQDGFVSDARVLRSIPLLDQAAVDAVMQWRFTPTLLNGQNVPVIMTVTVNFALDPGVSVSPGASAAPRAVDTTGTTPPRSRFGPKVIKEVKPKYPLDGLKEGVQGTVEMEVTIGTEGKVTNARVVRGVPMLNDAAIHAVLQWEFEPPAQPVVTNIEMTFSTTRRGGRN